MGSEQTSQILKSSPHSHSCVLVPESFVLRFIQVAKTLIPSVTEMISANPAKQMLNAGVIPKASLNQGVLNASSRPAGLENFHLGTLTHQLVAH